MARKTRLQIVEEQNAAQAAQSVQETGLTVNQHIDAFLAARMAERKAAGLKITTLQADGELFTCYPKDDATKQRWLNGFARKGATVVES